MQVRNLVVTSFVSNNMQMCLVTGMETSCICDIKRWKKLQVPFVSLIYYLGNGVLNFFTLSKITKVFLKRMCNSAVKLG